MTMHHKHIFSKIKANCSNGQHWVREMNISQKTNEKKLMFKV